MTDGRERWSDELGDVGLLTGLRRGEIRRERALLLEELNADIER